MTRRAAEEDAFELQLQITAIAAERVTWEAARSIANDRASYFYLQKKDGLADEFRRLGDHYDKQHDDAERRQRELLRQQELQRAGVPDAVPASRTRKN